METGRKGLRKDHVKKAYRQGHTAYEQCLNLNIEYSKVTLRMCDTV